MNYVSKGTELRREIKELVFDYMSNSPDCGAYADGLKQAEIFRQCGLDWGEYPMQPRPISSTGQQPF